MKQVSYQPGGRLKAGIEEFFEAFGGVTRIERKISKRLDLEPLKSGQ